MKQTNRKSCEKYILTLTPEQLSVVERACEFYSRIRIGQLNEIDTEFCLYGAMSNEFKDEYFKRIEQFREKLEELERIAFPDGMNNLSKDRQAEIAWNVYQATRYVRSWHEHPEGGITVNFDRPLDISGVGIPECIVQEAERRNCNNG